MLKRVSGDGPCQLWTRSTVRNKLLPTKWSAYYTVECLRSVYSATACDHHIITSTYLTELFYDGDFEFWLVWLTIQPKHGMYWYITSIMDNHFFWYDWNKGRIVGLPMPDCDDVTLRYPTSWSGSCTFSLRWTPVFAAPNCECLIQRALRWINVPLNWV